MSGAQRKLCAVQLNNTLAQFRITRPHSTISLRHKAATPQSVFKEGRAYLCFIHNMRCEARAT